MSVKIIADVWHKSKAKGTARLVMLAIADHCNPSGIAWPSLTRLASYVNVNRRNTINAINQLVKMGELTRIETGQTGRATTYKITLGSVGGDTGVAGDTSVATDTQVVSEETPQPSLNRHITIYKEKPNFEDFWKAYPKKVGRGVARQSYLKALKKVSHNEIMKGLVNYNPDPEYTCNPSTWLNQERWSDEPDNRIPISTSGRKRQKGGELSGAYQRFRNRRTPQ